jgi:hypothetical protein
MLGCQPVEQRLRLAGKGQRLGRFPFLTPTHRLFLNAPARNQARDYNISEFFGIF